MDIIKPVDIEISDSERRAAKAVNTGKGYISGTEVMSIAYDIVQKTAPHDQIAATYGLTVKQLAHEITQNKHLQQAIKDVTRSIEEDGSLVVGMQVLLGETLPYVLADNKDPLTEPSIRSRNAKMAIDYLASHQKGKEAKEMAAANQHGMAAGMTINFNVTPGIRGISEAITIEQDKIS